MTPPLGDPPKPFLLPDTEGRRHVLGSDTDSAATLVVWTCNHCPYAIAWHDRLLDVARDYEARGVRTVMVNSNDSERYPRDSLEAMRERVASENWPVPYLHDETQRAAQDWGAETTPDCFVLDREGELRYRGAPDSDYEDPSQGAGWVRAALDAVLDGADPEPAETQPVGCSIKWRP